MKLGLALILAALAVAAAAYFALDLGHGPASLPEGAVRLEDPATHWQRFVELSPPILLPGDRDGQGTIRNFVQLPKGASIGSEPDGAGGVLLKFPPGTIADRVEYRHGSVVDVRGTTLLPAGEEEFHVYRPLTEKPGGPLYGFVWKRGDAKGQKVATERLVAALDDGTGWSPGEAPALAGRTDASARLGQLNQCDVCHVHGRRERTSAFNEPPWPRRGTDASGFFVPGYVMRDDAPLELHRPVERNLGRPGVHFTCASAAKPGQINGTQQVGCPDGSVPRASLDFSQAQLVGDADAQAACASRVFLSSRMDPATAAHFAAVLAECQATAERVAPVVEAPDSTRVNGR